MSISMKKATSVTSIKHNNREFKKEDWETKYHKHIDPSRSQNNQYLIQKDIHTAYDELFGKAVAEYNGKQKRKDRRIDDYYSHIKHSKSLNLQQEFVIQIGDIHDFEWPTDKTAINYQSEEQRIKKNWEMANEILKEYVTHFEERNPNLKIYNAVIHNDETSPHLHMNVIPVARGYKQGVKCRPSMNRALEEQGYCMNQEDSRQIFRDFRETEISELADLMCERGIERKFVGKNHIQDIHEYKRAMSQVAHIDQQSQKKAKELSLIRNDIEQLEQSKKVVTMQLNTMLEVKEKMESHNNWHFLSDDEKLERAKQYIPNIFSREDKLNKAEKILELEQQAFNVDALILASKDFLNKSDKDIQENIETSLETKIEPYKTKIESLECEKEALQKENSELRKENKRLKYRNSSLKCSLNVLKDSVRDFINKCSKHVSEAFFERLGTHIEKRDMLYSPIALKHEEEMWVQRGIENEKQNKTRKRCRARGNELEL